MKKTNIRTILVATIAVLAAAGTLAAHHSIAQFDTEKPLRVKGTIVAFELINPHSRIFLDQKLDNGQTLRWSVDGPGAAQLARMSFARDVLKVGDVVEVCGFTLKAGIQWAERLAPEPISLSLKSSQPNVPAKIMNGHVIVTPDGQKRFWSDYGQIEKCLEAGETRDSLIR